MRTHRPVHIGRHVWCGFSLETAVAPEEHTARPRLARPAQPGPGGHRRAGRRAPRVHRAASRRVLGAHADAGRSQDPVVHLCWRRLKFALPRRDSVEPLAGAKLRVHVPTWMRFWWLSGSTSQPAEWLIPLPAPTRLLRLGIYVHFVSGVGSAKGRRTCAFGSNCRFTPSAPASASKG
jgi:hypothetical protein